MSPERPVVIVNPRSGGGLSEQRLAALVALMTDGLGPFDLRRTEAAGDGKRIALEEARAGRKLLVACGGDGTISEIVNGILAAGTSTELGIIHRGTGGDFRRTFDLPTDVAAAARRIRDSRARLIDVGRVTLRDEQGVETTRHFVNVASFGFSATVAERANASAKRFGARAAFLSATVRSLVAHDNVDVWLTTDGREPIRRRILLGAVGNARFFGGGMEICPKARVDDGVLDLVTVGDISKFGLLRKIGSIYEGTHLGLDIVHNTRVHRIEVRPVEEGLRIPIELDGETPFALPATFEVVPAALRLRA